MKQPERLAHADILETLNFEVPNQRAVHAPRPVEIEENLLEQAGLERREVVVVKPLFGDVLVLEIEYAALYCLDHDGVVAEVVVLDASPVVAAPHHWEVFAPVVLDTIVVDVAAEH